MRIGIDYHGTIERYPSVFRVLTLHWSRMGHDVHIVTGMQWKYALSGLKKHDIFFNNHFSIIDYHIERGTSMEKTDSDWWMEDEQWFRSKGDYCRAARITLLFDNDLEFGRFLPETCTFILVPPAGFEKTSHHLFNF